MFKNTFFIEHLWTTAATELDDSVIVQKKLYIIFPVGDGFAFLVPIVEISKY